MNWYIRIYSDGPVHFLECWYHGTEGEAHEQAKRLQMVAYGVNTVVVVKLARADFSGLAIDA